MKVMDSSRGDRPISWDEKSPETWAEAEKLFDSLTLRGGRVFVEQPNGEGGGMLKKFDPQANMIATPLIVGG